VLHRELEAAPVEAAGRVTDGGENRGRDVVETRDGLVVLTGCAQSGVVEMVRRAQETVEGEVALVMGGFHLGSASRDQVEAIITDLRQLGVQQVAPCHCTGDQARRMFAEGFGGGFFPAGVGWTVCIAAKGGPE